MDKFISLFILNCKQVGCKGNDSTKHITHITHIQQDIPKAHP